ncbi:unnamed protein product [Ectocarpus fasciculatus]
MLARLNCARIGGGSDDNGGDDNGDEPPPPPPSPPQRRGFTSAIFFLDAVLWVFVGARARCSPFWRGMGLSLDLSPGQEEGGDGGSGGGKTAGDFGAVIDSWVSCHPFSWLGNCVFGRVRPSSSGCARHGFCCAGRRNLTEEARNNGLNVAATSDSVNKNTATTGPTINSGSSSGGSSEQEDPAVSTERRRRARVLVRSVGETLVVDPLFLALSAVSRGGWDGSLAGIAGISAVFSALQLLTELRYYVKQASAVLDPVPVVLPDDDDDDGGGGGGGGTLSRDEENQHSVWSGSDHSGSSSDEDSDGSSSSSLCSSSISSSDGRSLETASERVASEC